MGFVIYDMYGYIFLTFLHCSLLHSWRGHLKILTICYYGLIIVFIINVIVINYIMMYLSDILLILIDINCILIEKTINYFASDRK